MHWLNLHLSLLDSPEFLGSEPVDRATWLCLLRYCCGQENGGTIRGCGEWSDRQWQQLVRITREESKRPSALWEWRGSDLWVWEYPAAKESEVKRLRKQAKDAGDARWKRKKSGDTINLRSTMTPPAP